jgi:hypothetical protein
MSPSGTERDPPEEAIRGILKSQYHAAFAMLRDAVEKCPDALWTDARFKNACWQVGYHVTFIAHTYLQRDPESLRPWARHQADVQYPDGIPGPPEPGSLLPLLPEPYSRADVLEYLAIVDGSVDGLVDAMDVLAPESGFSWYRVPKLEHQLVNLRHVQHHTAQLADRVRAATDVGVDWVGARRKKS